MCCERQKKRKDWLRPPSIKTGNSIDVNIIFFIFNSIQRWILAEFKAALLYSVRIENVRYSKQLFCHLLYSLKTLFKKYFQSYSIEDLERLLKFGFNNFTETSIKNRQRYSLSEITKQNENVWRRLADCVCLCANLWFPFKSIIQNRLNEFMICFLEVFSGRKYYSCG